jgi:hypothetical protein
MNIEGELTSNFKYILNTLFSFNNTYRPSLYQFPFGCFKFKIPSLFPRFTRWFSSRFSSLYIESEPLILKISRDDDIVNKSKLCYLHKYRDGISQWKECSSKFGLRHIYMFMLKSHSSIFLWNIPLSIFQTLFCWHIHKVCTSSN